MKINYKISDIKKDETVLFLHGWGANLNSFNFFYDQLSKYCCCLSIDFVGFGGSEKLKYPLTVFDYACYVYRFLSIKKIKRVTIICHSFGARIAILLATIFDLSVVNLVVIGGAGVKPRFNILNFLKIYSYKLCKVLNKTKMFHFNLLKFGSVDYVNLNDVEKQTFIKVVGFNELKYLKQIKCKTLLVWGNQDKSTPLYMGKIFNRKIKNSTLKIMEKCGHFCFLEQPKVVLLEILQFLNLSY